MNISGGTTKIASSVAASLLAAVAIVFGVATGNLSMITLADIAPSMAIMAVVAVLGPVLCALAYRPLVPFFPIALFLSFDYWAIKSNLLKFMTGGADAVAFTVLLALLAVAFVLIRRVEARTVSRATMAIMGIMAVAALIGTLPHLLSSPQANLDRSPFNEALATVERNGIDANTLPDIIYVVPDRYASEETLQRVYGHDNSAFYEALSQRGFSVDADAMSNYPETFQSLGSMLNSSYLGGVAEVMGPDSPMQQVVLSEIENSGAQEALRAMGYRFVNIGFWWEPTRINRNADENFHGDDLSSGGVSEFGRTLVVMTPIPWLISPFGEDSTANRCAYVKRKFEYLAEIGNDGQPVFAFAHFAVPHSPLLMDADGNCRAQGQNYGGDASWDNFRAAYVEYLRFFNRRILDVLDRQLEARASDTDARELVFVIQADEGPYPKSMRDTRPDHVYFDFDEDDLRMKLGIINAMRLPGAEPDMLAGHATPINNWRLILTYLTGAELPLLPDRSFIFRDKAHVYDFRDVSHLLTNEDAPQ